MAKSFSELKRNRAQDFERIRNTLRFDLGTQKRMRLIRARCRGSGSLLHADVAKRHAEALLNEFKKRVAKLTRAEAQQRLRFLTVLHSVVPLDKDAALRDVTDMETALHLALESSSAWLCGAVEVEIVSVALLRRVNARSDREARKLNVLEGIGANDDKGVLIHFHGLVDLGELEAEEGFRRGLDKIATWQRSPYQVELKRLFKEHNILRNLEGIATYLTKGGNDNLRYNAGFGRDLDTDLEAKIWRAGMSRGETVPDERGLTISEVAFLDALWCDLMRRSRDKRGYVVRIGDARGRTLKSRV